MRKSKATPNNQGTTADLIAASLARYKPYLSPAEFICLTQEIEQPPMPAIRANLLKVDPITAMPVWKHLYGWETLEIPYYPHAWQITHANVSISQTIEHRMGEYYIQDAASMLPVALFDTSHQPGQLILDMAASPGGKTTQLIDLTDDKSFILANDASASRLQALRVILQNWGATNFAATGFSGEILGNWFPETFDMILLDAPCSMENLRPSSSHPARATTDNERQRLATRQINMLISAFKALKPGGQLVYATCTLAPEEDEAVLDALITAYPAQVGIEDVSHLGLNAPGLAAFADQVFHPGVHRALRLWPHISGTSGFFAAKIRKNSSLVTQYEPPPTRPFSATGLNPLPDHQLNALCTYFEEAYGFSLEHLIDSHNLAVFYRTGSVVLIPQVYLSHFQTLPYHTLGMVLGKQAPKGFIPSHEFISRFGYEFRTGFLTIPQEYIQEWIAGRDIRGYKVSGIKNGSVVVVKDLLGRNLGSGKVLANRIRNLLPARII